MKILFLLDNDTAVVVNPEQLSLRQIQPDLAALAIPAGENENKEPQFQPIITFPVVLSVPPPRPEPIQAGQATPVPDPTPIDASPKKKRTKKA